MAIHPRMVYSFAYAVLSTKGLAPVKQDEDIVYIPGTVIVGGGNTAARDLEFNDSDCDGSLVASVNATILNDDGNGSIAGVQPVPSGFFWSSTLMVLGLLLLGRRQLQVYSG